MQWLKWSRWVYATTNVRCVYPGLVKTSQSTMHKKRHHSLRTHPKTIRKAVSLAWSSSLSLYGDVLSSAPSIANAPNIYWLVLTTSTVCSIKYRNSVQYTSARLSFAINRDKSEGHELIMALFNYIASLSSSVWHRSWLSTVMMPYWVALLSSFPRRYNPGSHRCLFWLSFQPVRALRRSCRPGRHIMSTVVSSVPFSQTHSILSCYIKTPVLLPVTPPQSNFA